MKKWIGGDKDMEISDFGQVISNFGLQGYCILVDQNLAKIVGWDEIPVDDNNDPYEIMGIATKDKIDTHVVLVCSGVINSGIDKNNVCVFGHVVEKKKLSSILDWEEKKKKKKDEKKKKEEQLERLFVVNKVDHKFVTQRREELRNEFEKKGGENK